MFRQPALEETTDRARTALSESPEIRLTSYCSLHVERNHHLATARLVGEFDMNSEDSFQANLMQYLDNEVRAFVMDIRGLTFMDSTGIRILLQMHALARDDGFDFTILCGNGHVRRTLRQSGVDGLLPLIDPFGKVPSAESAI